MKYSINDLNQYYQTTSFDYNREMRKLLKEHYILQSSEVENKEKNDIEKVNYIINILESFIKDLNKLNSLLVVDSRGNLKSITKDAVYDLLPLLTKIDQTIINALVPESTLGTGAKYHLIDLKKSLIIPNNLWDKLLNIFETLINIGDEITNKSNTLLSISRAQIAPLNEINDKLTILYESYINDLKPLIINIIRNYNQTVESDKLIGDGLDGDGLYKNDFEYFLNESYNKKRNQNYKDWTYLSKYSDLRTAVYKNNNTNEIVISNRGTYDLKDVKTDIKAFFNVKDQRIRDYRNLVKRIKKDYPNSYIISIGHSLGGYIARQDPIVDEVLTFNSPKMVYELFRQQPKNEYNVRTSKDPISILSTLGKQSKNDITFNTSSYNPIKAHMLSSLEDLEDNKYIGNPN